MPSSTVPSPVSPDQYRAAMRSIPAAVTVVTACHAGEKNGLTATAVSSLSAVPPQLLVCVNRDASAHALIAEAGRFVVNFLSMHHEDIANRFGQSKLDAHERFAAADWVSLASGAPALADAHAAFDCLLVHQAEFGTHSLFVGAVVDIRAKPGSPLVYHLGRYCHLLP